jgi:NAD-dependent DNA ligase
MLPKKSKVSSTKSKSMIFFYYLLPRHNDAYYNNAKSLISDQQYDELFSELVKLEKEYPELKLPHSPTDKVGASVNIMLTTLTILRCLQQI